MTGTALNARSNGLAAIQGLVDIFRTASTIDGFVSRIDRYIRELIDENLEHKETM